MYRNKKKLFIVRQHSVFFDRQPSFGTWREELIQKAYSSKNCVIIASKFDHYKKTEREEKETNKRIFLNSIGYKKNISLLRFLDQIYFGFNVLIWILFKAPKNSIFLFSYPTQEAAVLGYLGCYIRKYKYILDVRDIVPPNIKSSSLIYVLYTFYSKMIEHIIFKNTNKIVFMSFGLFKKYRQKIKKIKNKYVILNPIKILYSFKAKKIQNLYFVGNLNNSFDFSYLQKCPKKVRINIIGDGEKLNILKKRFKKHKNISFYGALDQRKIHYMCKKADGFLAFYKSKNFKNHITNKIIFYLRYNKPIFHNLGKFNIDKKKQINIGKSTNPRYLFKSINSFKNQRTVNLRHIKKINFSFFKRSFVDVLS